MKCPFELPVTADEELFMLRINGKLRAAMIIGDVDDWNDEKRILYLRYIVQAINSHEKLTDALAKKFNEVCEHILSNLYPKLKASHKKLKDALEEAGRDFYDIHRNSDDDAHNKSYEFANKIKQVLKELEKL